MPPHSQRAFRFGHLLLSGLGLNGMIVSGSDDNTVRVWNPDRIDGSRILTGHWGLRCGGSG